MLRRSVRAFMTGESVLVRNDRPPIVDREIPAPSRHRGAMGLERLRLVAFTDAPEPVGAGHFCGHLLVAERRRLDGEAGRRWAIPGAVPTMANGTLGLKDLPTLSEDRPIRPQTRRGGEILIFRRHRHVNVWSRSWLRIVRSD